LHLSPLVPGFVRTPDADVFVGSFRGRRPKQLKSVFMAKVPALKADYIKKIRNIGIIAHIDAGKTTLTERILFYTHRIHRMGEVHDGTAAMDYMPEEQERGITITSACTSCDWRDMKINIIDTPGHVDFTIEVQRSLRVLDGAVGVFCAVGGVEPQSETVWRQSEGYRVPKLAFVNKMDRLGADFTGVLESMKEKLAARPLAMQIPVGQGADFTAIIDLLTMEKLVFDIGALGEKYERLPLSEDEREKALPWRERLVEALAEQDDELLELYLSGEQPPLEMLKSAVRKATLNRELVPVFAGSALKNIGVQPVLDAVVDYLPSPVEVPPQPGIDPATKEKISFDPSFKAPLSALVFKVSMESGRKLALMRLYSGKMAAGETVYNVTQDQMERAARLFTLHAGRKERVDEVYAGQIAAAAGMKFARTGDSLATKEHPIILERISAYKPVISMAVEPKNTGEADRLEETLNKFLLEDPTLDLKKDEETGQLILSGMGELHLEVTLDRLRREYNVEPRAGKPQVVYQETVGRQGRGDAQFNRELAEAMHYGYVALSVEPRDRDSGNRVVFELDTSLWPEAWIEAVEKGVQDGLQSGVLKGYPVHDVRVAVIELRRKEGESSEIGYRMAAAIALKQALADADPKLMEPLMWLEINVPEEFVGEVISLLGAKGAKVENMFDRAGQKTVQALTPLRRLFGFSTELRSATQGRVGMIMRFARFDVLQ